MSVLEGRNLTYAYDGDAPAVRRVSVSVERGEVVALIGPNGAGKSTLLQLLSGHVSPREGRVNLGGRDLAGMRPSERARFVTLVPQMATGQLDVGVAEMVALGRLSRQTLAERLLLRPQSEADRKAVEAALDDADLARLRDRRVGDLSGGERERVRLAMALAQETDVLCLDEPSAHMDPGHAAEIMGTLAAKASSGRAVVVALHDLNLASLWAHRLVLMRGGSVVGEGVAQDVLTPESVREVFGPHLSLGRHPSTGRPVVFPAEA